MSSIINAILGKDNKGNSTTAVGSGVSHGSVGSSSSSAVSHTAISDDVRVKSIVSTDTKSTINMQHQQKINDLMAKLSTTHNQIDEYSKKRHEQISEAVQTSIQAIVQETQKTQEQLLQDANLRSNTIEQDYKVKLQVMVEELDASKAQALAQLEKDLNQRQEDILAVARKRIDELNEQANQLKMGVLKEAQAQANAKMESITDQVASLSAEDAQHRLQSTTTTVITTKAASTGETHVAGATAIIPGKTTIETTTNQAEIHKKH